MRAARSVSAADGCSSAVKRQTIRTWAAVTLAALTTITPDLRGAEAFGISFWVWHRTKELTTAEQQKLSAAGVNRLYWHVGDLRREESAWQGELRTPPRVEAIEVVPVIRLGAGPETARDEATFDDLAELLADYARATNSTEIQIDYDCPDRLLQNYAKLLRKTAVSLEPVRLSATALAGWPDVPGFSEVAAAVDALFPMFYDLRTDHPEQVRSGVVEPIVSAATLSTKIPRWQDCGVEWWAGLPAYARVSIFDPDGRLSGHLLNWDWDELIFHPSLRLRESSPTGVSLLDVFRDDRLGDAAITAEQTVAIRLPDVAALAAAANAARSAGGRGIAWFRLSDTNAQSMLKITELTAISDGRQPVGELGLFSDDRGRLVLKNQGDGTLLPRFQGLEGPNDRGRKLDVELVDGGTFLVGSAGEFLRVAGHRGVRSPTPERVPPDRAERLSFWFAGLGAGESLRTGVIRRMNDSSRLRWRVDDGAWQFLDD